MTPSPTVILRRTENQAAGLACYCRAFLFDPQPIGTATLARLERFHLDAVGCGVSAIAHGATAPTVLRREALAAPPSAGSRGGRRVSSVTTTFIRSRSPRHARLGSTVTRRSA